METYKGYKFEDYSQYYGPNSYSVVGCVWLFDSIEKIKGYLVS